MAMFAGKRKLAVAAGKEADSAGPQPQTAAWQPLVARWTCRSWTSFSNTSGNSEASARGPRRASSIRAFLSSGRPCPRLAWMGTTGTPSRFCKCRNSSLMPRRGHVEHIHRHHGGQPQLQHLADEVQMRSRLEPSTMQITTSTGPMSDCR